MNHSAPEHGVLGVDDIQQNVLHRSRIQHHLPDDKREVSFRGQRPHTVVVWQRFRKGRKGILAMVGQGFVLHRTMQHVVLTPEIFVEPLGEPHEHSFGPIDWQNIL